MSIGKSLLWLGAGIGLMYLLDPNSGPRRRRRVAGSLLSSRRPSHFAARRAPTVEAQVRAAMRDVVSDPSSIAVVARGGVVTLNGTVLRHEEDGLLKAAFAVPGVREIINQLQSFEADQPPVHPVRLRVKVH